ncbi:MAG: hypothetical protein Q8Q87_01495, partial [Candidatus Omnitrophota bacterium]|nr:hypothetical protein [Candidatus Omnitrophota bacterium]
MSKHNSEDTIVAISTPVGEGGIGIVRMSGPESLKIADEIFLSRDGGKPSKFKTHTTHYGHIVKKGKVGEKWGKNGKGPEIIDEVILTVMRAPKSYTREE